MPENVDNLILEHLRAIRAQLTMHDRKFDELTVRLHGIENAIAGLKHDVAHHYSEVALINSRIDGILGRIERIEKRLEISST